MTKKVSLDEESNLSALSTLIEKSKKCVIITGAGISSNAGIPVSHLQAFHLRQEFRSPDGLYYKIADEKHNLRHMIFHISVLKSSYAAKFYEGMKSLRQQILSAEPTPTHKFIRSMDINKKLVRCYTQNFDSLESKAGLEIGGKVIQLHGNILTVRCMKCRAVTEYPREGAGPFDCPECSKRSMPP